VRQRRRTLAAEQPALASAVLERGVRSPGHVPAFRECLGEVAGEDPFDYWCTHFGSRPGKTHFTDAHGWYPGLEYRPDLDDPNDPDDGPLFFRDIDASVVIPSEGNKPYSTRIVNENGITLNDLFGVDLGSNIVLGNGNPRAGLHARRRRVRPPGRQADGSEGRSEELLGRDLGQPG
jgi:hypothetical protein